MSDEDFNKKQEIVHDEKNAGTPHILGGGSHFDPNAKDVAVKTVFNADYAAVSCYLCFSCELGEASTDGLHASAFPSRPPFPLSLGPVLSLPRYLFGLNCLGHRRCASQPAVQRIHSTLLRLCRLLPLRLSVFTSIPAQRACSSPLHLRGWPSFSLTSELCPDFARPFLFARSFLPGANGCQSAFPMWEA